MFVLAIDTTSIHGGVAIYRDSDCLVSLPNTGTSAFSVTLFQMVDQALAMEGAKVSGSPMGLRDIDLFAAATGPGSFTGIRTGLAAVQGWATALKRPVVGVSVLAAMVHAAEPVTESAAAILDGRRGEFYFGFFRRDPKEHYNKFGAVGEGIVATSEGIRKHFEELRQEGTSATVILRSGDAAGQALRTSLPDSLVLKDAPEFLVQSIAQIALEAQASGHLQSAAELDALYIRRSDAELNWRP